MKTINGQDERELGPLLVEMTASRGSIVGSGVSFMSILLYTV